MSKQPSEGIPIFNGLELIHSRRAEACLSQEIEIEFEFTVVEQDSGDLELKLELDFEADEDELDEIVDRLELLFNRVSAWRPLAILTCVMVKFLKF